MKRETLKKIERCAALRDASIGDIVRGNRFQTNLSAYLMAQREDRAQIRSSYEAMKKLGGAKGYKLPAHVIDRVSDLSVEEMGEEYLRIITHKSERPVAERQYIFQLCRQAYNLTVSQIVCEEFPELREELLSKGN